jgi:hypothetical protein
MAIDGFASSGPKMGHGTKKNQLGNGNLNGENHGLNFHKIIPFIFVHQENIANGIFIIFSP